MFFSLFLVVLCSLSTFAAPHATEIDKRGYMIGLTYIIKHAEKGKCTAYKMTELKEIKKPRNDVFLLHGENDIIQGTMVLLPQVAHPIDCTLLENASKMFNSEEMAAIDRWYMRKRPSQTLSEAGGSGNHSSDSGSDSDVTVKGNETSKRGKKRARPWQ